MSRSPRPTKTGRRPAIAEALKNLWQDQNYRNHMIAAWHRSADDRRDNPHRYSRLHIPNGMHKAEAIEARRIACEYADKFMTDLKELGVLPAITVPDSDDEIAETCVREAVIMALSPGDKRIRLMAINTVLKYTKAPPVQRVATAVLPRQVRW